MTAQDQREFARQILIMAKVFQHDIEPDVVELYFRALMDLSIDQLKAAVFALCNTKKNTYGKFPLPAEIREAITGTVEDRAVVAYDEFTRGKMLTGPYHTVIYQDKLIHAVIMAMGGWEKVCEITEEEWKFRRKEFIDLYRAFMRHPRQGVPDKLAGIIERTNSASGWRLPDPVYITAIGLSKIPLQIEPEAQVKAIELKDDEW